MCELDIMMYTLRFDDKRQCKYVCVVLIKRHCLIFRLNTNQNAIQ